MKWLLIIGVTLAVLYLGAKLYFAFVMNANVLSELKSQPDGERAEIVMILTFPDGRELPVNYLREGEQVFAGADGRWWRAFKDGNVPVSVFIKGETYTGRARTVLDDPAYTKDVFTRLRPNVPKWIPDWADANLVVIDLDS